MLEICHSFLAALWILVPPVYCLCCMLWCRCTSAGLLVLPPSWKEKPYFLPDHCRHFCGFWHINDPCIDLHPLSPLRQLARTLLALCPSNTGMLLPDLSPVSLVLSLSPSKHRGVTRIFLNRFFNFKSFMRHQLLFIILFLTLPSKYALSKHTSLLLHLYSPYLKSRQNTFFECKVLK